MKKLFLLAGLLLCIVLVQAMGVKEPPGMNFNSTFVCDANHQLVVAPTADMVIENSAVMDYAFLNCSDYAYSEPGDAESLAANLIQNEYNYNPIDRGNIVSRNGVINFNNLNLSIEPESILKFKANARTWVNLTTVNFHYLCLKNFQLTNFDGKAERFY